MLADYIKEIEERFEFFNYDPKPIKFDDEQIRILKQCLSKYALDAIHDSKVREEALNNAE